MNNIFLNIKNWIYKNSTTITIFVLIGLLVFVTFKLYKSISDNKKANDYSVQYKKGKDSMDKRLTDLGDTVAKKSEKLLSEISIPQRNVIDSFRKLIKIKDAEIQKYVSIYTTTDRKDATGKLDTVYKTEKDTIPVYSFNDRWLQYNASAFPDSLHFNQLYFRDSTTIVFIDKKVGNKYFKEIHVVSHNPYSSIQDIQSINWEKPKEYSPIGIGISGGATYYNGSIQPYIGIGINYNLIRFKKKQ